jgi:lectin, mannose-binding 1
MTPNDARWSWISPAQRIKDAPANTFSTDAQRFEDLHNRLSVVNSALDILYIDLTLFKEQTEKRHEELIQVIENLNSRLSPTHDHVEATRKTVDYIKREINVIRNDVESKDYREHLKSLQDTIKEGHAAVMTNMPDAVNSSKFVPSSPLRHIVPLRTSAFAECGLTLSQ